MIIVCERLSVIISRCARGSRAFTKPEHCLVSFAFTLTLISHEIVCNIIASAAFNWHCSLKRLAIPDKANSPNQQFKIKETAKLGLKSVGQTIASCTRNVQDKGSLEFRTKEKNSPEDLLHRFCLQYSEAAAILT